ncbi:hypothetical protein [Porcincola intestinalis]|uniref:DUF2953 domain-containing protein n=1 Tax=Porcincola intestinalis TaxID=2606632 RepID=A0A6L5X712_9FIRM|nr:hypothetical protein [Porcincola intestinalis]MSS15215.1 hypothetical protein [Porcincola intestinalis]
MVQIILAILRIIGIILLIVLGIAAVLILLVLFWPVEYQISLRKEDQAFEAEGRAGWLFHLLSADVQIRERTGTITLKIFGRRLKTFRIPEGRRAEAPHSQAALETGTQTREDQTGRQIPRGETDTAGQKTKTGGQAASDGIGPRKRASRIRSAAISAVSAVRNILSRISGAAAGIAARAIQKAAKGLVTAMAFVFRMQELPSDLGDFSDTFHENADTKIESFRRKAEPFVSPDAFSLYGRIMRHLGRLLRSLRFRRLEGYLLVGTGKPDLTGELIGLLYMILPDTARAYELRADFYQATLKTRTNAAGHIRMNHVLMFLIRLLRDKEFRKLLAHVRRKGKEGSKGRSKGRSVKKKKRK